MKSLLRILLALAATAAAAFAQTGTAIPGGNQSTTYFITKPGRYYLAAHRVMTNPNLNAIEIASDDVTLDLNGHTVAFATSTGTGHGIYGKDLQNTEIRGGGVATAPQTGVFIDSTGFGSTSSNTRIIDTRVSQAGYSGIRISGDAIIIDRCSIDEAGNHGISTFWGTTILIQNCSVSKTGADGITSTSANTIVKNCIVADAAATGVRLDNHSAVENCHIGMCNTNQSPSNAGIRLGAFVIARNNTVTSCKTNGIYLGGYANLLEGNTLVNLTGFNAVGADSTYGSGLMINNRYSKNTPVSNKLTNGGGNIAF